MPDPELLFEYGEARLLPASGRVTRQAMGTLYLHIGMQKTGTSALQLFFQKNRGRLKSDGIIYPRQSDIGVSVDAISFQNCVATTVGDFGAAFPPAPEASIHALRNRILRSRKSYLLSGESFSRIQNLAPLRKAFAGVDMKIILYLREQADWAQSLYNQRNKILFSRGDAKLFENEIPSVNDFFRFLKGQKYDKLLDYDKLVKRWGEMFGQENIRINTFPPKGDLAEGFLATLGIADTSRYRLPPRVNESLSSEWIAFVRNVAQDQGIEAARKAAVSLANQSRAGKVALSGPTRFLPDSVVEAIREDHEQGNRWIAREYFGRDQLFAQ